MNSMKKQENNRIDKIGNELPFSVPENYFENFAQQIENQIGYKSINHRFLKPWMYIAAMFVGVILVGQLFFSVYQNNSLKNTENYESYVLSQVDETALMDYYVDESTK